VLVEAFVLGREEGFLHVLGDIGERNPHSALVLLEDFGERPTSASTGSPTTSIILKHCPGLAGVLPRTASAFAPFRSIA